MTEPKVIGCLRAVCPDDLKCSEAERCLHPMHADDWEDRVQDDHSPDSILGAALFAAGEAASQNERLRAAVDLCMVGGNHLASLLIQKLGPSFAEKYPPDLDPESALRMLCATDEYDIWCCWSAIMRARDSVRHGQ